ncbi:MAG TPA: 2-oxo-4-hydroxy-4-carboxy-5-ureidoimidazoline decarboxylase [Bryobacteraceae bacterium]|jgi:2-oxo-4-hydroxy-4-carboxy-5-ureidoimidazoline decarboxylase|nr:2-oxo-4-hydroxy-4-carboxy-5-ureidoimidazoline decarboxylase [Bryobacteraceae bacterium]
MTLTELNTVPRYRAEAELNHVCGSRAWVRGMAGRRPFGDLDRLLRAASDVWWSLDETDWQEAFSAHPKIGAMPTSAWSAQEQSGMRRAGAGVATELEEANQDYLAKFGYIFIVCASGKSAEEMLAILRSRVTNAPEREIRIAAEEQGKIIGLRLEKLLKT